MSTQRGCAHEFVAQLANRIAVMRAGKMVESGAATENLREPASRHARDLLAAVPEIPRTRQV